MKVISPFGPKIAKLKFSNSIINKINAEVDSIINKKKLLNKIKKPNDEIRYRDLNDEMVFVSGLTESGMNIDEKDQNENHKKMFELSNQLVKDRFKDWTAAEFDLTYTMRSVGEYMRDQQKRKELLLLNYEL